MSVRVEKYMFRANFIRRMCAAMLAVYLNGCAPLYAPKPVYLTPPFALPEHENVPGANITVGAIFCETPSLIKPFFDHEGLWRAHALPLLLTVQSSDVRSYDISTQEIILVDGSRIYRSISPSEAYDLAWKGRRPYLRAEKTIYYGGLILVTIVTLGLASFVWGLPSPFGHLDPSADPFGRDLAYKAMPATVRLDPGTITGGFLYFHPLSDSLKSPELTLVVQLRSEGRKPVTRTVSVALPRARGEEESYLFEWIKGHLWPTSEHQP